MKLGGLDVAAIKLGALNVTKVMRGADQVWPAAAPPDPPGDTVGALAGFPASLGGSSNLSQQYGNTLLVGADNLTVRALRHYASTASEEALTTLRLWRVSDEALLASVNVTGILNTWVQGSITPVELVSGQQYIVSARLASGANRDILRDPAWFVHDVRVSFVETVFVDADTFPGSSSSTDIPAIADIVYDIAALPDESAFDGVTWSGAGSAAIGNRLGWRFTVGASDVVANKLRVFVNHTTDELVLLHRHSDGRILAAAEITGVAGAWAEAAITPVLLEAGDDYVVSARRTTGATRNVYRNPSSLTIDSRVTKVAGNAGNVVGTGQFDMPTGTSSNVYTFVDFGFAE